MPAAGTVVMRASGRIALVVVAAVLVAGCAGDGTASPAPSTPGSKPVSSSPQTATAVPATPATATPPTVVPGMDRPPDAVLAAEGGDPVLGQLGTYVWLETGTDAPWLPGAPIAVGAGEPLSVRFEPDGEIVGWRGRYVPAGQTDPGGAVSLGEGTGAPAFPAPPPGSWTAEVTVDFGQNVGSASYFWRLDVQ